MAFGRWSVSEQLRHLRPCPKRLETGPRERVGHLLRLPRGAVHPHDEVAHLKSMPEIQELEAVGHLVLLRNLGFLHGFP